MMIKKCTKLIGLLLFLLIAGVGFAKAEAPKAHFLSFMELPLMIAGKIRLKPSKLWRQLKLWQ